MADKNKNPITPLDSYTMQDLFAEMGITPPISNNNNKIPSTEPSLRDLMQQEDRKTNKSNSKPKVLVDHDADDDRFCVMNLVGTSPNGGLPVYRAAYMALHNETYENLTLQDVFVAVKFVDINGEPEVCGTLKRQVDLNGLVPDHKNLVGIRNPFIYNGYLCVVFPFMEHGSLRHVMSTRCPNGFQEDNVVLALKETLVGLSVIHGSGHVHREINAGRIFFNGTPEIKLAFSSSVYDENRDQTFSASVYDDDDDQGQKLSCSSKYLSMDSICKWGAAPEVYGSDNEEYTAKADIWLIGITALELAYGGVKVTNREELESIVKKINKKKKLPKRKFDGGGSKSSMPMFTSWIASLQCRIGNNQAVFSKGFERMVVRCLALRPEERPSADELLQDEVFANKSDDMSLMLLYKLLRLARGK